MSENMHHIIGIIKSNPWSRREEKNYARSHIQKTTQSISEKGHVRSKRLERLTQRSEG
jgi:hypothetical protein